MLYLVLWGGQRSSFVRDKKGPHPSLGSHSVQPSTPCPDIGLRCTGPGVRVRSPETRVGPSGSFTPVGQTREEVGGSSSTYVSESVWDLCGCSILPGALVRVRIETLLSHPHSYVARPHVRAEGPDPPCDTVSERRFSRGVVGDSTPDGVDVRGTLRSFPVRSLLLVPSPTGVTKDGSRDLRR